MDISAPCPDRFNLAEYVLGKAAETPPKIALSVLGPSGAEDWSYGQLNASVCAMAGGLSARLAPWSRVMLRLGNTPDFPIAFLGAIAAGLVPVPTAAGLTRSEITRLAELVPPDLILAHDGIACPDGTAPVVTDLGALMEHPPVAFAPTRANALAYIVFTSGSSGGARAVAHAHRAVWARRMMHQGWEGLGPDDRLLHAGAFNWTYTLGTGLMDPWAVGATALVPHADIDPGQLPDLLHRHDATIFATVPGIYRKILKQNSVLPLPRLRHGLSAGEALPAALRLAWNAATGCDIHEALGMSECSTFVSGSPSAPARIGTTGAPQPGRRVAVLSGGGAVQPGETGELAIHKSDPGLMLGYWDGNAPRLPLVDEWFLTGDLVAQDRDGHLTHRGRADDLITAGGFRISPTEIEAAFDGPTPVAACSFEVKPGTFVVALAVEGAFIEEELRTRATVHLADYKRPRLYRSVPALPRSPNGKLLRRALPDLLESCS